MSIRLRIIRRRLQLNATLLLLFLSGGVFGAGNSGDEIFVSYLYAAVMGSGTYTINDRRVTMLRLPFSWIQREATEDTPGWKWLMPVVVGYDDLGDVDSDSIGKILPDQLTTLTVLPGFEYIYPVTPNWQVKPFFQIGGGRDFSSNETILMTQVGVRSLTLIELGEDWELRWGNTLRWAGEYQLHSKDRWSVGVFDTGLDIRRNTPLRLFDKPLDLGAYYIYQYFSPQWRPSSVSDGNRKAANLHHVGLSVGLKQKHKILGIPVRRVRVGYKTGGGFQGWTIGTEFPF